MTSPQDAERCPFCGGEPKDVYVRDGRQIRCIKCGAAGPSEFHGPADGLSATERAIAAWNRRASLSSPQEPVVWCNLYRWRSDNFWPDDCFFTEQIDGTIPLYAAPQAAPAVSLTDEQIDAGWRTVDESGENAGYGCSLEGWTHAVRWAERAILAAAPHPMKMLTQAELDELGAHAEGLDGNQWDAIVQRAFAKKNNLTVEE